MFAVNGPSGPTQRNERRRRTDAELAAEERRRQDEAQRKREGFFQLKSAKTEAKSGGDAKEERGSERAESSGIFKGCRIVFNGRTGKVSSYCLAKLVQEHGGNVSSMQMITASRITHMVGCILSAAKADKILKKLGKLKFVTPDWILQSVRQNKRLPEYEFLVYKDERGAAALKAAFTPNQHETPRDEKWQEKRKI